MIRPPSLELNDKVVVVSPAGKINPAFVTNTVSILEEWGVRGILSKSALLYSGHFSGSTSQRLADLQLAMDDPEVKAIFCSRGGYGAIHLLQHLNFEKIIKYPKWLLGFSDITALHCAFQKNELMSIHAPMSEHFSNEGPEDASVGYVHNALFNDYIEYSVVSESSFLNRDGDAIGKLFGGNLSVFSSLLGTNFISIPDSGILFIEDIGEKPYRVDRMMNQLKLAGIFDNLAGLIVGQFNGYEEDELMYEPLFDSMASLIKEYSFPVAFNFPIGHTKQNFPVIMGAQTTLCVEGKSTILKQSY